MNLPLHSVNATVLFTPLTYGVHKLADKARKSATTQRILLSSVYVARPIDRLIQIVVCPLFAGVEHFHDIHLLRKKKDRETFLLKLLATPLWLPTKALVKTVLVAVVSFRDLLVDDLLNIPGAIQRISRPKEAVQDYWLLRDFEEREAKCGFDEDKQPISLNVWHFSHYEPAELKRMDLEQRAHIITDMKKVPSKEILPIYGVAA